jgi:hypothetical protein
MLSVSTPFSFPLSSPQKEPAAGSPCRWSQQGRDRSTMRSAVVRPEASLAGRGRRRQRKACQRFARPFRFVAEERRVELERGPRTCSFFEEQGREKGGQGTSAEKSRARRRRTLSARGRLLRPLEASAAPMTTYRQISANRRTVVGDSFPRIREFEG